VFRQGGKLAEERRVRLAQPGAPVHHPVGGGAQHLLRGGIHLHHRQRGGVPGGVCQLRRTSRHALIRPGGIQQQRIGFAGLGRIQRRVAAGHQLAPRRSEHPPARIQLLAEELGPHQRMRPAQPPHLLVHKRAVRRHLVAHLVGGQHKRPADAVLLLGSPGGAQLARQQRAGSPRRAPEDPGGVGGGSHGGNILVELGNRHILRLVHLQQRPGGCAHNVRLRRAAQEEDARPAHPVDVAGFLAPQRTGEPVGLQHPLQAAHGVQRLGLPGGRNLDDLRPRLRKEQQQVGFQLRLQFVLARLAREHHHEGKPAPLQDGIQHRLRHRQLVGAQRQQRSLGDEARGIAQQVGKGAGGFGTLRH